MKENKTRSVKKEKHKSTQITTETNKKQNYT